MLYIIKKSLGMSITIFLPGRDLRGKRAAILGRKKENGIMLFLFVIFVTGYGDIIQKKVLLQNFFEAVKHCSAMG